MEEGLIARMSRQGNAKELMEPCRKRSPGVSEIWARKCRGHCKAALVDLLRRSTATKIAPLSARPWVVIFLGVNGVGKTTTIGKAAAQYRFVRQESPAGRRGHLPRRRHPSNSTPGAACRRGSHQTSRRRRSVGGRLRRHQAAKAGESTCCSSTPPAGCHTKII